MYKYFIISLLSLMFLGCTGNPKPEPKPVIVTEYKYINVEVPCEVPKVSCDFNGTKYEPTVHLLECIVKLKKSIKVCQKK